MSAEDLFARHLDLEPLRGRRRGLVRCIFHEDRTPSLSLDLDAGIFHCFGCGVGGGIREFARRVGEGPAEAPRAHHLRESPLERARREVIHLARRQPWALAHVRLGYELAEYVRRNRRAATDARHLARRFPDDVRLWEILALAARVATEADRIEAALDELLYG